MGEVLAAEPLLKALQERHPDETMLVLNHHWPPRVQRRLKQRFPQA